jgi:protein-S-isoprenylcysteine O-methyltransferase Ste14
MVYSGIFLVLLGFLLAGLSLPATAGDLSPSTTRGFYFMIAAILVNLVGLGLLHFSPKHPVPTVLGLAKVVYLLGWLSLIATVLFLLGLLALRVF